MNFEKAREIVGRVAENPLAAREVRIDELLVAIATVMVRTGQPKPNEDE